MPAGRRASWEMICIGRGGRRRYAVLRDQKGRGIMVRVSVDASQFCVHGRSALKLTLRLLVQVAEMVRARKF